MTIQNPARESSTTVQAGDHVTVSYIGTLDNGRVFDQTDDSPRTFTIGNDEIFPALENAIIGMKPGDVRNILIPSDKAFGARRDENIIQVDRQLFPQDRKLRVGEKLSIEFGSAGQRVMRIINLNDREVTLDGNHELAGWDLTFALRLDAIDRPAMCS